MSYGPVLQYSHCHAIFLVFILDDVVRQRIGGLYEFARIRILTTKPELSPRVNVEGYDCTWLYLPTRLAAAIGKRNRQIIFLEHIGAGCALVHFQKPLHGLTVASQWNNASPPLCLTRTGQQYDRNNRKQDLFHSRNFRSLLFGWITS